MHTPPQTPRFYPPPTLHPPHTPPPHTTLQLLVHAADISNPARPLRFSSQWGRKVHEEFFAQGELPQHTHLHPLAPVWTTEREMPRACACVHDRLADGRERGRRLLVAVPPAPAAPPAKGEVKTRRSIDEDKNRGRNKITKGGPPLPAGDKESALGLSVSAICDRGRASVPQSQLTFIEYVVRPCFRWETGFDQFRLL